MATIAYLTRIEFEHGALARLSEELRALAITRPLLVTDKGLVAAGLAERARAAMGNAAQPILFDATPANPTEAAVMEALAVYRGEDCDGVVAIGGGSSMDLGKAVALMATHEGALTRYVAIEGGMARITDAVAPLIAIPTTAGTGSEVGRGSVIVLGDGRKVSLLSQHLVPKLALCDPDLTLDLPPLITAATGMDAMAHCIETFISRVENPPAEGIAIEGLRRCAAHIERAVADGADAQARYQMMMASMMGAMAFQKGLGVVHAMSHPMGALPNLNLHHGTLNAVVLPTVLRFNEPVAGAKYPRLKAAMGLAPEADVAAEIEALNARLGLPAKLSEMGVSEAMIPELAIHAEHDHTNRTNPRQAVAADYETLFREAL